MSVFKNLHHSPRPFWIESKIKAVTCYDEFGNPSGHSLIAAHFTMYLFFTKFYSNNDASNNRIKVLKKHYLDQRQRFS